MERVNELNDISSVLEKSKEKFCQILSEIGWSKEFLEKDAENKDSVCPVDSGHSMPTSSLAEHVEKCQMKKERIDPKDVCPSSHFFYKNSLAVVPVLIDRKKYESFKITRKDIDEDIREIKYRNKPWECVPSDLDDILVDSACGEFPEGKSKAEPSKSIKTADSSKRTINEQGSSLQDGHVTSEFPLPISKVQFEMEPAQRLAVYDYVVETAKNIKRRAAEDELEDLQHLAGTTGLAEGKEHPKTHFDAMAAMRDYKRRRQSYRAKNVHMTKRTSVEVMRDLIETQMKTLEYQYKEEHDQQTDDNRNAQPRDIGQAREEEFSRRESREGDKYRVRRTDDSRHRDYAHSKYTTTK